ncbi:MAG: hypothetical protein AAB352_03090 [Patescibacteria group bacterium]
MDNEKILTLILLASILILPGIATAQTVAGMVTNVVNNVVWPFAIGAVVVLWIATGLMFLTAQGEPGKLTNAKSALVFAIAGTVIVVIANLAIGIVCNALGVACPVTGI